LKKCILFFLFSTRFIPKKTNIRFHIAEFSDQNRSRNPVKRCRFQKRLMKKRQKKWIAGNSMIQLV